MQILFSTSKKCNNITFLRILYTPVVIILSAQVNIMCSSTLIGQFSTLSRSVVENNVSVILFEWTM